MNLSAWAEGEEDREDRVLEETRLDEVGLREAHLGQGHLEVRVPPEGDRDGLVLAQPVRERHPLREIGSGAWRRAERVAGPAEDLVRDSAAIVGGVHGAAGRQGSQQEQEGVPRHAIGFRLSHFFSGPTPLLGANRNSGEWQPRTCRAWVATGRL
jgi:hypothetical protein